MASKGKAHLRRKPLIYPDSIRPPPVLPDAESVLKMGLTLTEDELSVIRMAMAIHTASKQPKLTWTGWRHIATALDIGSKHARKAAKGRLDTPDYRRVMTDFLRSTGFTFLNKDDRAAAVRLLERWDEIDAWRGSLPHHQQQRLNNPRETWAAYLEHRKALGDPEAKIRPTPRKHRQFPTYPEQMQALIEQVELANERAERAERESEYFEAMTQAIAKQAKMGDKEVAQIRAKVRAELAQDRAE
jgi:hypothetical protein